MRTTLDLPEDLLDTAKALARGRQETLGKTVAYLMRRGLEPREPATRLSTRTGLPVIRLGIVTTAEDVKSLEDDE